MPDHKQCATTTVLMICMGIVMPACALCEETPESDNAAVSKQMQLDEITMNKLGITQIWADIGFRGENRLQVDYTGTQFRIVGDQWKLILKGSEAEVRQRWDELLKNTPPVQGVAVLMVHGITRSSWCFNRMKQQFQLQGWNAFAFDYPSTYISIEQGADYLAEAIDSLNTADEIHIVAHSMGGLVTRRYFQMRPENHNLARVVMLGTPNTGAELANRFGGWYLYQKVMGPAGQQLAVNPEGLINQLPSPSCEFGLVAGGRGPETSGYNFLLEGDDDFTVRVDSVYLEGAADYFRLPCTHVMLMRDKQVIHNCIEFLKTGKFLNSMPDEWQALSNRVNKHIAENEQTQEAEISLMEVN